jgi:hypothetical protein
VPTTKFAHVLQGDGISAEGYDGGRVKPLVGEGVNDVGHLESREDDYMWRMSIGAFRRRLQIVMICNAPKVVYSRKAVAG